MGVESTGFDGLQFLDMFVDHMAEAAEGAERLTAAQRSLSEVLREQLSLLQAQSRSLRDTGELASRLAGARDRYRAALRQGDKDEIAHSGKQLIDVHGAASLDGAATFGKKLEHTLFTQLLRRTGTEEIHAAGLGGEVLESFLGIGKGAAGGAGAEIAALGASLHPVGIAALALVESFDLLKEVAKGLWTAAKELWQATSEAAHRMAAAGVGRFISGGTPHEQAKLTALGSLMDMTPEEIGGVARQFGETITSTPRGRVSAIEAGIDPYGGRFGNLDHADRLLRALDHVHRAKSDEEANRWITYSGLDPAMAAKVRNLSDGTWERLLKSSQARSPIEESFGMEFAAQLQIIKNCLSDIKTNLLSSLIPIFTIGMRAVGDVLGFVAENADLLRVALSSLPVIGPYFSAPPIPREPPEQTELKRNTEAVHRLTDVMEDGIYGDAAAAARKAAPSGMESWWTLDRTAYNQKLVLGGISL